MHESSKLNKQLEFFKQSARFNDFPASYEYEAYLTSGYSDQMRVFNRNNFLLNSSNLQQALPHPQYYDLISAVSKSLVDFLRSKLSDDKSHNLRALEPLAVAVMTANKNMA